MKSTFVFLRAINVGGHTVKNDRLVDLFGELGYGEADAFLASGNLALADSPDDAAAAESAIEEHLQQALDFEVATFLRSAMELRAVADFQAFPTEELPPREHRLYVAFLKKDPGKDALRRLLPYQSPTDAFVHRGREIYWLCKTKSYESKFSGAELEKTLEMPATLRYMNTVRQLVDKFL